MGLLIIIGVIVAILTIIVVPAYVYVQKAVVAAQGATELAAMGSSWVDKMLGIVENFPGATKDDSK